jgi:glyoxylase-like metal-dependent hydrolase (beta-lactamase superfamily II)
LDVREVRTGLWAWEQPHPERTDEWDDEGLGEIVSSYALQSADSLVLVDPLAPPAGSEAERFWEALDRDVARHGPPAVLLTIYYHARSSREILERYEGASVWVHEPARELMAERTTVTDTFLPGEELPGGVVAYDAARGFEVVFWAPAHRALFAGDVLLEDGAGGVQMCPPHWTTSRTQEEIRDALRPVLELPVELVCLAHGGVVEGARAGLARAIAG